MSAIVIGLLAGSVCYFAVGAKMRLGYDDSLDAVGVHGVGGSLGALATGLFASKALNAAGSDGLFFGNASLLGIQALSVGTAIVYSFIVTWIILKVLDATMGVRVQDVEEMEGLDLSQHGESGYSF
jgi:Amt family ammonium transporter